MKRNLVWACDTDGSQLFHNHTQWKTSNACDDRREIDNVPRKAGALRRRFRLYRLPILVQTDYAVFYKMSNSQIAIGFAVLITIYTKTRGKQE